MLRFDTEIGAREPATIIFALGTNDSWYFDNNKNKPNVSLDEFKKNLRILIVKSQETNARILFIGPPKVDESKVSPIPWRTEVSYDNDNIQRYNQAIRETCEEYRIEFIETFFLLKDSDFSDGLHPNTEGHTKLFEEIKKHI